MVDAADIVSGQMRAAADVVLDRWQRDPHALVQVLRETQAVTCWLPRPLLAHISAALGRTLAQVEGVAGFYRFFHTRPVGRTRLLFSDNITDRMLGSEALLAQLCARLGVALGEVDAQGRFSVDRCSCTGLCDQGPALLVNHHQVITRLDATRVDALADLLLAGAPLDEVMRLIRGASLFVGNDSGPAHIAAAFAVPSVVLFGPSDPRIWGPWRAPAEVLHSPGGIARISLDDALQAAGRLRTRTW